MSQVQSGILPEHCRAAIWIEANVKGDVNALREASKIFVDKVATFQAKFPDAKLGAVVAFGWNVRGVVWLGLGDHRHRSRGCSRFHLQWVLTCAHCCFVCPGCCFPC